MAEAKSNLPMQDGQPLYGLIAQFDGPSALKKAAAKTYDSGYRDIDAFTPFPVHDLAESMGVTATRVPRATLCGGLLGFTTGLVMQTWASVYNYPLNIGGKPLFSWPAFIPICYELMILFAAIATLTSMLTANKLPRPYHPVFNAKNFESASRDGFFLLIEATDKSFDLAKTKSFLASLNPKEVSEVYP